ncbi:MAG TPA: amidohydrolase family protein [Candidatus Paceibacterota bacterium]|nr:amidohydrolase family protein [Candidatus Paceibacterota bacterium]
MKNLSGKAFALALCGLSAMSAIPKASAGELLPPGFRPAPLGVHALTGARVVTKPGEVLENGTIVLRDGLIQSVGTNTTVPADARVWDLKGSTVYAGFIEPYLVRDSKNPPVSTGEGFPVNESSFAAGGFKFYGAPGSGEDSGKPGPGYEIARVTPEFHALDRFSPKEISTASYRELGFTAAVVVPGKGIFRGRSGLVALTDDDPNRAVIRNGVFQHVAFDTADNSTGAYPASLMGVIAAIRQTLLDADHYQLDQDDYRQHPARKRPEFDPALSVLAPVLERKTEVIFEPGSALMDHRAAQLAREFNLRFSLVSCGEEWRRPDLAKATGATFIVPVNFPSVPKLPGDDDWNQISLDQLRAWDWAPENPAVLRQQGLQIALTTYGLGDKKSFRKNLQLSLDRGLSETDALAALTTVPAKLCGVADQLGTIEAGKAADLVVVSGKSYFDPEAKVRAVWIDGRIFPTEPDQPKSADAKPASANAESSITPPKEEPEKHPALPAMAKPEPQLVSTNAASELKAEAKAEAKPDLREIRKIRLARSPLDERGAITNPPAILIRGATVWTCGPLGILTNAQILIADGKIQQVGFFKVELAGGTFVIDAAGLHVTPGVIDCHSHAAVLGNVNETGLPSTAMVRISDVVNAESENLYRELAGGVTTINLFHGSANPIGGQSCVIKLRDGAPPAELLFSNAPSGIKFALGENVKQANWGEKFTTRFPQTRMGVRTFIQNRFVAAQEYLKAWEDFRKRNDSMALPPRRDLELEAIGEILQGKRWIHCHAYRQDEMLMLTRLMQGFGVQIGTFQHGLDAYKIADELAAAHIGVSTFSDWWGLKVELFDAIPYNGSLLHDRGVLVSYNSDYSELARRLYLEAAKAVKYGGLSETEALKFVTINPAKQLRIDQYVGSLEPGKDADFAVWSKSPLDSSTVCLQTWIDGKKFFDRTLDAQRTKRLQKEREDLIAKAKKLAGQNGGGENKNSGGKSFFHVSLEHEYDGVDRRCENE